MASEVDICNLALGHLGDAATVSSLNPPEGSAQAEHCARFYPIARDSLLELHAWNFSTTRVALASLGSDWPEWQYCYACPTDAVNLLAVLGPSVSDDYSVANNYGLDSGRSIVQYFLSNAQSWRGPVAKAVKAELKKRVK